MKDINKNDIMDITLLSIDEAKNVPKEILQTNCWWWLRSPGVSYLSVATIDYDEDRGNDGDVYEEGICVEDDEGGIRPALIIKNLESSHLQIGEKVECLHRTWFYVGENLILSEYIIDFRSFNPTIIEGNRFLDSDIKRYLDDTLAKWLAE